VTEEGIVDKLQFLLLAVHHIHRVVEHDIGNPRGARGHENGHSGLTRLKQWEAADMILMGMGEDRRADRSILHILQQWRCVMAYLLGIHSTVKDHGPFRKIEAVTVGTDPGTPRQIRKTHEE
jgi:hypothetical protein